MRGGLLMTFCALGFIVAATAPAQAALDDGLVSYFKLDETSGTK